MELLATIRDTDLFPDYKSPDNIDYQLRISPRVVLFDKDNKTALLYVSKYNYYKIPGGGQEEGESREEALIRECKEEVGCDIDIIYEIGEIVEFRDRFKVKQETYCYLAKVKGDKGQSSFDQGELQSGFQSKWADLSEAISLVKNSRPEGNDLDDYDGPYAGKFIVKRDLILLEKAKEILNEKR